MPMFEVAIIEKPTKNASEDGAVDKLVFGPKAVIAASKEAAIVAATKSYEGTAEPARMEVLVRPFA